MDLITRLVRSISTIGNRVRLTITKRLVLSFLLIILMTSLTFTGVIIFLIDNHIQKDLREQAQEDLGRARSIYLDKLDEVNSVVRSTASRPFVEEALLSGDVEQATDELSGIKILEALDYLTVVDATGEVQFRSWNTDDSGDTNTQDKLVDTAMKFQMPAASTTIVEMDDLSKESPQLANLFSTRFSGSEDEKLSLDIHDANGMALGAAAPVFDSSNTIIGAVYGGVLLNDNHEFVCEIKQDIYRNAIYKGHEIGFVKIYQEEMGILSCPYLAQESVPEDSRLENEAYQHVVTEGKPWIGRDLVMDDWYVTASQPIWNTDFETIGVLQTGIIEQKYLDIRDQIIVAFLAITAIVSLIAVLLAFYVSRQISVPINRLLGASRKLASGDLDARVDLKALSDDELVELAKSFNVMASALEERDEKLRELTRHRIKRSERLALIGKLAANVAHELNNPLQGIVTYSHLMLEEMADDDPKRQHVQIIVTQANRCREIIRALLDFSRQREPDKTVCDVNVILQDCIILLVNQALFHNIEIETDIDIDLPSVVADPSQLERVFLNLMVNGAEAMEGSGRLTLITRFDDAKEAIEVLISDTGYGISEENLKRIFDPFYTTKEVGKGTGLGLAISYGITMEHGGKLSVVSEVGQGTTFTIRLPIGADVNV